MSSEFFANKQCKYYPCHKMKEINCLFCFCPIFDRCAVNDKCESCTFPHIKQNYKVIVDMLKDKTWITLGN
jgi:Zn-finger protein